MTLSIKSTLASLLCVLAFSSVSRAEIATSNDMAVAIAHVYQNVFDHIREPARLDEGTALFSQSLKNLVSQRHRACAGVEGPCEFGANGNPFLNAQDYSDRLSVATANLKVGLGMDADRTKYVLVTFDLFPGDSSLRNKRVLKWYLGSDGSKNAGVVVTDIVYVNPESYEFSSLQEILRRPVR